MSLSSDLAVEPVDHVSRELWKPGESDVRIASATIGGTATAALSVPLSPAVAKGGIHIPIQRRAQLSYVTGEEMELQKGKELGQGQSQLLRAGS